MSIFFQHTLKRLNFHSLVACRGSFVAMRIYGCNTQDFARGGLPILQRTIRRRFLNSRRHHKGANFAPEQQNREAAFPNFVVCDIRAAILSLKISPHGRLRDFCNNKAHAPVRKPSKRKEPLQ
ncbi:MAG: hypothetical protein CMI63_06285 [Parvularcula sp.]|nr:hypothetical protein [Parvularcula sp.]